MYFQLSYKGFFKLKHSPVMIMWREKQSQWLCHAYKLMWYFLKTINWTIEIKNLKKKKVNALAQKSFL